MADLRNAVDAELKEDDLQGIVRAFVDKAKKGDEKAAKFVLEYLMGGKFTPQSVEIHNHYHGETVAAPQTINVPQDAETSNRHRVYACIEAGGPAKPEKIAAELHLPLATVEGVLQHSWFARERSGAYRIAVASDRKRA